MGNKAYHRLLVWKKANAFVIEIYKLTASFPKEELFGLISQLRRAAVSVAANIVEGQAKNSPKDFLRFLYISRGSLSECEYYLELAHSLDFIQETTYKEAEKIREEEGFLLHQFLSSIKEAGN